MAVRWDWKNKIGNINDNSLYLGSNCLAVVLKENTENNTFQFIVFFDDFLHLKKCLGIANQNQNQENIYAICWPTETTTIKLNTYFGAPIWTLSKAFARAGYIVQLYYEATTTTEE